MKYKFDDRVYIIPIKSKGVIKSEISDEGQYKVTYHLKGDPEEGKRYVDYFEESELDFWKVSKKKPFKRTNIINCTIDDENLLPKYESVCASGMDLRAWKYAIPSNLKIEIEFAESGYVLDPFERVLVKTGLHIELPYNMEAQIRPRSGLALKNGISIVNTPGTIDEDYRGDIGVTLINLSTEPFVIKKGDKIAQMIFQKVQKFKLNVIDKLSDTIRGEGGFGSTGK